MKIQKLVPLLVILLISCSQAETATSVPPPTRLPSPTNTSVPKATLTIAPSPTAYPTQVYGLLTSPDGTKRVQSLDRNNYDIVTADGTVLWSISYENKLRAFEPAWYPFYWSTNEKYIYFTCYHGPDDGSTKFFGNDLKDGDCVYRFDIETGKLAELIPEILPGYYAFTISPDGNQLLFSNQTETPVKLKSLDLNTLAEKTLFTADEKYAEIGSFGWSPKMDKLVFVAMAITADENNRFYSIFMLDLKSLNAKIIAENLTERLRFDSWSEEQILFRDSYHESVYQEDAIWVLDLLSQVLSPLATATPKP